MCRNSFGGMLTCGLMSDVETESIAFSTRELNGIILEYTAAGLVDVGTVFCRCVCICFIDVSLKSLSPTYFWLTEDDDDGTCCGENFLLWDSSSSFRKLISFLAAIASTLDSFNCPSSSLIVLIEFTKKYCNFSLFVRSNSRHSSLVKLTALRIVSDIYNSGRRLEASKLKWDNKMSP